jgi:hypothetical protein
MPGGSKENANGANGSGQPRPTGLLMDSAEEQAKREDKLAKETKDMRDQVDLLLAKEPAQLPHTIVVYLVNPFGQQLGSMMANNGQQQQEMLNNELVEQLGLLANAALLRGWNGKLFLFNFTKYIFHFYKTHFTEIQNTNQKHISRKYKIQIKNTFHQNTKYISKSHFTKIQKYIHFMKIQTKNTFHENTKYKKHFTKTQKQIKTHISQKHISQQINFTKIHFIKNTFHKNTFHLQISFSFKTFSRQYLQKDDLNSNWSCFRCATFMTIPPSWAWVKSSWNSSKVAGNGARLGTGSGGWLLRAFVNKIIL